MVNKNSIDEINVCIPVVSAIIERNINNNKEILIQTRWKPKSDPKYSWTFEIPAWWIDRYENVYDALKREVFEETWLTVSVIKPNIKTEFFTPNNDSSFAFVPFCCQQQLLWWKPWIGFVFLCEVLDWEIVPQEAETKDVHWIWINELKKIVKETPEKIFTLQLGALNYYLQNN